MAKRIIIEYPSGEKEVFFGTFVKYCNDNKFPFLLSAYRNKKKVFETKKSQSQAKHEHLIKYKGCLIYEDDFGSLNF